MPSEKLGAVKGFGRMQMINRKTGKIVGDSGWNHNIITQSGFDDYIVGAMGGIAASSQVTHVQLGTQTDTPASTQTSMSGDFTINRKAVTASLIGDGTLRVTASWATNEATHTDFPVGAIGCYGSSAGGSIANVLTVATSQKTTDQELNATVEFRFPSA